MNLEDRYNFLRTIDYSLPNQIYDEENSEFSTNRNHVLEIKPTWITRRNRKRQSILTNLSQRAEIRLKQLFKN